MAVVEAGGERRPEGVVAEEGSGSKEGAEREWRGAEEARGADGWGCVAGGGEMEGWVEEAVGGAVAGGPSMDGGEGGLGRGGRWWRRWGACRCGMNGRFGHDGLAG